jgi:GTP-binding protein HflX
MKAVTGSDVGIGDRPFHTLDPTTRSFEHQGASYVMTDTVGFIEKLPHQLVEAFKATLEETALSDLILLVIDASSGDAGIRRELAASESVLDEIGAGDSPRLIVLNKTDRLNVEEIEDLRLSWPGACLVSALTGEGIEGLLEVVARTFEEQMEPVELLVPYGEGARLHELHEVAAAIERRDEATGVRVSARLPSTEVYRFVDLAV